MINENTLNEENSDLKGTILKIVSPNIQKHLDDLIKQYGDKAEIIKHIVSAIDDKPEYSLTYEYAKKIKNYFDNFKGNNTSEEYQLHGGIKLKNYINLILAMKRDSISTGKDIRKNMTILNNTHLKSHDKSTIGLTRNPMALKEHIELIENYIPTKKASCGVILNPEKNILLVKRGIDTKWFPGKWALVGGKVDGDEEFKDAFVREVKEETNLDLDFIKYCFNKHDGDCEVALFVAITKTPNDIKINKEHSEYKWCTANEIKELDCVPHIYEDISECLKLITNNKEDLLAEEYKHSEYLSWKRKNVTIRGIKEAGQENNAGAMLGRGLYTAFLSNKELAKQYGTVKFVVNAIPKKPKVFNTLNEWEIFFYNTLIRNYCKEHGLKESRTNFSQNTTIEDEMQKLGFDGIIIKGREMVNYKPENVVYFSNENQLKFYYEDIT
jgi:ADP-ribose pyrophosphatase YjhB (NUDIX family)